VISRRGFIQAGAAIIAGTVLPFEQVGRALAVPAAPPLGPFVDPLAIPPVKAPVSGTSYALRVEPAAHSYHRDLPATAVYGYDGIYPGPTFVATRGTPITVEVTNGLTAGTHPFHDSFDPTIPFNVDDGSIAVHLHGGETEPASDGNPMDMFLPGASHVYAYGNSQHGTTLWYHDHAFGNTRLNVMAGLAGFYLLVDPAEEAAIAAANPGAGLPAAGSPYLIGLAIQDRDFFANGAVDYPTMPDPGSGHMAWVPEYFANTACVNGKATPYLEVEPRRYRFRVLNGSQARFYKLSLDNGAHFKVLGSDGGYLAAPVDVASLFIAPGERYDVVIDFTNVAIGTRIVMTNDAPAPFPSGTLFTDSRADTVMNVMQFRVTLPYDVLVPNPPLPATLTPIAPGVAPAGTPVRSLFLNEQAVIGGPYNDVVERVMLCNREMLYPATEQPQVGATEIWEIANTTGDTHPIHLHLVQFRLLGRQAFKSDPYWTRAMEVPYFPTARPFLTGGPTMMGRTPRPQEAAWKDTVLMHPGEVTRILVRFAPQDATAVPGTNSFAFDPTVTPGYVWHCHILEHEENDMMRPLMPQMAYAGSATTITIHANVKSIRRHHTLSLTGLLTPGQLGDACVVEARRPGQTDWRVLSTRTVSSVTTDRGRWSVKFTPGLHGTYSFRVRFHATADRTGSLSSVVKVRVK
jgi:FtsP/CotA-like multicopper oxidase with cupredoxin domain